MEAFHLESMTKRAYGRYPLEDSATLVSANGIEEPSILKDISCRGAGVITSQALRLNDKLSIIIKPSSFFSRFITRQARVAWCQQIATNLWQGGLDFGEDNKIPLS